MDDLITALELLRERHRFGGYIHVKLVPGGRARADRAADRSWRAGCRSIWRRPAGPVSASIAPEKSLGTTIADLERVRGHLLLERAERADGKPADALHPGAVAGMTMQFVVGATRDTDRTILGTVGPAEHRRRHSPRALQRLPPHREHADGRRARHAGAPRASALPGGLPAAAATDSRRTRWSSRRRQPPARGGPQERLGARPPRAVPRGDPHRVLGRAAARAGHRSNLRTAHRRPSGRTRPSAAWPISAKLGVVTTRAAGFLTLGGRRVQTSRWTEQLGFWAPEEDVGVPHLVYQVSPGTFR